MKIEGAVTAMITEYPFKVELYIQTNLNTIKIKI